MKSTEPISAFSSVATQAGASEAGGVHIASLHPVWPRLIVVATLVCLILAGVAAKYRTPWSDEGWFSNAAHNLAKHGFMGTTVIESKGTNLTRIEQRTYWVMPLFLLGQALWYKLFPATVFWTRAFTMLWVPFLLLAFFLFLAKLVPKATSALATILLALSFIFIDNAGFARPDLMCCCLGLAGLAAFTSLRETSFLWSLFVGNLFIALSIFTHPNGIFHFAGLVALVIAMDWRRITVRALCAAAAPYILSLGIWGLYIAQDPRAFLDQMTANGTNDRWTPTLNLVAILWNEIRYRYFFAFGLATRGFALLKFVALAAYLAAIAGVMSNRSLRRERGVRLLLMLLAVYFAAMSVFNQKLDYYLVHILPLYIAILAIWVSWLWNRHSRLRSLITTAVIALIALQTGGIVLKARERSRLASERAAIDFLRAHTGPSAKIVGTAALIYDMNFDDRLKDDMYLGLKSGRTPDAIVIEPLYQDTYAGWELQRPEDMRRIRARLSEYKQVYSREDYNIYFRETSH